MNDNVLKKEFKRSDVERVRNLVKKDFTSKTKSQTGYKKSSKRYKEGDTKNTCLGFSECLQLYNRLNHNSYLHKYCH